MKADVIHLFARLGDPVKVSQSLINKGSSSTWFCRLTSDVHFLDLQQELHETPTHVLLFSSFFFPHISSHWGTNSTDLGQEKYCGCTLVYKDYLNFGEPMAELKRAGGFQCKCSLSHYAHSHDHDMAMAPNTHEVRPLSGHTRSASCASPCTSAPAPAARAPKASEACRSSGGRRSLSRRTRDQSRRRTSIVRYG